MTEPLCLFKLFRDCALACGLLVDVTEVARKVGFRVPVAMTRAVYAATVQVREDLTDPEQTAKLREVLRCYRCAVEDNRYASELEFPVVVQREREGAVSVVVVKAVCSLGVGTATATLLLPQS